MGKWSSYTWRDVRTGTGQLLTVTCGIKDEDGKRVADFFREHVHSVDLPINRRKKEGKVKSNVGHGGYGRYSRYRLKQLKYAGGGGGYIEALEVKQPPDNRCPFVLHEYGDGHVFWEFDSKENVVAAFEAWWGAPRGKRGKAAGQLRRVFTGYISPWFYAIGDQPLVGDLVLPDVGLAADSRFTPGDKYVVWDRDGVAEIKTCLCLYMRTVRSGGWDGYPTTTSEKVTVIWADGTLWEDGGSLSVRTPRRLETDELWVEEALHQFRELLSGTRQSFRIPFTDGGAFAGRWVPPGKRAMKPGQYHVELVIKRKGKAAEDYEGSFHFEPTEEVGTPQASIEKQCRDRGVELVEVRRVSRRKGTSRDWRGVFERETKET